MDNGTVIKYKRRTEIVVRKKYFNYVLTYKIQYDNLKTRKMYVKNISIIE